MKKRITTILMLATITLFSCKKEPEPDKYYTVCAQIVNGTTGDTLYTALPISIDLEMNDQYGRPAVPRSITKTKMSAKDGTFTFGYLHLTRQKGEGRHLNIRMTIAGKYYFIPINQCIDTIIYKSNRAHIYIYIKTEGYTNKDSLYTYYYPSNNINSIPVFDTLVLPHNGFFKDISFPLITNWGAIGYRINNGGIEKYYDYKNKKFKSNFIKLKRHTFNLTGDPYKDTTTLILKK